ncbi:MAG: NAD+ synthase [Phycisphaerae bacterium]|nr:NAD+ synthase [Phycisphaerae bacterium]
MRVALAQLDPLIGDIGGNTAKILAAIEAARADGADLVVFGELSVTGYPPKDLLLKPKFVRDNLAAVERIAATCRGIAALVGFAQQNESPTGRHLYNSAALCADGRILSVHHKSLLPTYDVFDEQRYFESGPDVQVAALPLADGRTVRLGISICEDLWNDESVLGRKLYHTSPVAQLAEAGADVLINLSASPYWLDKHDTRIRLFSAAAAAYHIPLLFVNQVGGNDELIFDGASTAFSATGDVIAQARSFTEDVLLVDLDAAAPQRIEPHPGAEAALRDALVLGTRDYIDKCGFGGVVIGLSGGVDSAVTAALAVAALGQDRVHGVAMPSRHSSDHSLADARDVAEALGMDYRVVPIATMHEVMERELAPQFGDCPPDITEENIQARLRGLILMAMSNKFGWLVLTTGNKSELAVGYCTLYGDMCGGLAVIGDVPKQWVYRLGRYINERAGRIMIPNSTLTKPPSAELRPDQTDQDSLPPYDVLDAILHRYVEEEKSADEIVAAGFDIRTVRDVTRLVDRNEYKRKQAAPALKVTSRAFGFGRRMPIAARYDG